MACLKRPSLLRNLQIFQSVYALSIRLSVMHLLKGNLIVTLQFMNVPHLMILM